MQPLTKEARKDSPSIHFDAGTRVLEIKGDSYPENAAAFYEPVFRWLEDFLTKAGPGKILLRLQMSYINSSSSKIILNLLDLLENAVQKGVQAEVHWLYHKDNLTLLECGEEFAEDLEALPFLLMPLEAEEGS